MKTLILRPILHKDAYTAAVLSEVMEWFNEAMFAPLLNVLDEYGIPVDEKYQEIRFDEFGRANAVELTPFPPSWGSLGIARRDMPQIPGDSRGAFIQFLAARGVEHHEDLRAVTSLRPTQSGYHPDKLREQGTSGPAVLVSRDGYILDGHHQWAGTRFADETATVRVIIFDADIRTLLRLARELPSSERANAETSALEAALTAGKVQYADGVFSGKFSAAISRELRKLGATFDTRSKVFRLPVANTPIELRGTLARAAERSQSANAAILETLAQMEANIAAAPVGLQLNAAADAIVSDLGRQFVQTTAQLSNRIGITPDVDVGMRQTLNKALTENLELGIKDFAKERIPELRRRVEENVFQFGARNDRLAKIIEAEFGVSKRKAEFLADQETGLLTAKYREARYKEIGSDDYFWYTSNDARVRPTHRALNNKKFSFSTGANVSPQGEPARYCNPGEDWRCRCVPRPIVNLAAALQGEGIAA